MTLEGPFINQIMLRHGARPDVRLFRNHVGLAWHGRVIGHAKHDGLVHVPAGTLLLQGARQVSAGLALGSADLIGIVQRDGVGRFLSVEVKTPHVRTPKQQKAWARMVASLGGVHVEAHEIEDVDAALGVP